MKITLIGHSEKYTVECMALLFYPSSSFGNDTDNRRVVSSLQGHICTTTIDDNGEVYEAFATIIKNEGEKAVQFLVARSFYKAAKKLTGITPPWGILTGIRPSKIAKDYINSPDAISLMRKKYKVKPHKADIALTVAKIEKDLVINKKSISLYISIPFCPSRCSYCSFVSQSVDKAAKLIPEYLETLYYELNQIKEIICDNNLNVDTIYIGGGTPSVLNENQIETLLFKVNNLFDTKNVSEYTFEAGRPDTITKEKLLILKKYGITRISINPQTMNDKVLKNIGRKHSTNDILQSYSLAKECGFDNINMDVIAGLPGESMASFAKGLEQIIELAPSGITVHTLSRKRSARVFDENNELFKSAKKVKKMVEHSQKLLLKAGYSPYYLYRQKNTLGNLENVGYCIKNQIGRYNILTMGELQTIFAAGGGAISKVVFDEGRIERVFNTKYPYEYINKEKITKNIVKINSLMQQY